MAKKRKFELYGLEFLILAIAGLIVVVMYGHNIDKDIEENARYTLGKTTKIGKGTGSTKAINFIYDVKSARYGSGENYQKGIKIPDGKYLVKFSSKNPDRCKMLFEYQFHDSINFLHVPPEGWDNIPHFLLVKNGMSNQ